MRLLLFGNSQAIMFILIMTLMLILGCTPDTAPGQVKQTVPHGGDWGIYELDLSTLNIKMIYSTSDEIYSSALRLNNAGNKLVFAQKIDGQSDNDTEIFTIEITGRSLSRLTDNNYWDLYPAWSPDGTRIAFLSKRDQDLDIYMMEADGNSSRKLYDSGSHDADIDWAGKNLVFTTGFSIWRINDEGTQSVKVTDPSGHGEWGESNLPKGDYDPRFSFDGQKIVFERLEDINQPNGGYNLFTINLDGTGETRLTDNNYSQGIASWSHSGDKIIYVVAAIDGAGKYDMYIINSDGSENNNITPSYFPPDFLCYSPIFSNDDSKIFFIGQWWK
jgi:Tol biopolymer transport system component